MEPWAEKIVQSNGSKSSTVVDVSDNVNFQKSHDHGHGGHSHELDPHIWLNPLNAVQMVNNIAESLAQKDPSNANFYAKNADNLKQELLGLDKEFQDLAARAEKPLVFVSPFAYGYFVERYKWSYKSLFSGCGGETEASAKKITKIVNFIKENSIPCVFYSEAVPSKVAESIAEQTGVKLVQFHTLHNVSKEQLDSGVSFVDLMRENLRNMRTGLGENA